MRNSKRKVDTQANEVSVCSSKTDSMQFPFRHSGAHSKGKAKAKDHSVFPSMSVLKDKTLNLNSQHRARNPTRGKYILKISGEVSF